MFVLFDPAVKRRNESDFFKKSKKGKQKKKSRMESKGISAQSQLDFGSFASSERRWPTFCFRFQLHAACSNFDNLRV
jgi:hypothetical protein